ncbi:superoxide dismutase [Candidatus Dojkabacteria bacterium CG_4_10_14_3_um_filter_Dojkabacteria_WS6_41_9]|uniref:Superoxide dismutase n=1 Tax=Candidatus Dojkabacteria bacterium CG_4_10_14_0_2_um_filter_Dojkabacteria_WS6_41_15 TaxID=2014249 RepID=A0A2M7W2E3_9BACT|nr:MAG: superoxide dismutase [Candidatus Dojkabacteria bacterium CG_4_10_14_3_um_filter_Dojkabacteria_WS6_41_9]PJA14567.1 MAG: superoxide dismutase [Candidatus Dojkabacteria bacterium CG_4_10_14_0_2_um_filter_Dojkabacteria_WS6_41_15]
MRYELAPLPYTYEALEPVISKEIMKLHHDKHHAAYVAGANTALEKLEKNRAGELPDLDIKATLRDLSFHVSGHLLHELFWSIMRPVGSEYKPIPALEEAIIKSFGTFEAFQKQFSSVAKSVEGSGWAVLYATPTKELVMMSIEKHNLNHLPAFTPVLALDVWEHAYYLDYRNDRAAYVDKWWSIVNWDEVAKRISEVSVL